MKIEAFKDMISYLTPTDPIERKCVFFIRLGLMILIISIALFSLGYQKIIAIPIQLNVFLFLTGFVMAIISSILMKWYRHKDIIIIDERMKKIKYKSGYYSLIITIVVFLLIAIFDNLRITKLPLNLKFFLILASLGISFPIFYWYFNKKGDMK